ncbi:MAG: ABC transporter ATP-binding protein [Anaerolineae bacterium]
MIEIRKLVKAFGNRAVLKGVDLSVAEGEFLTLVGPNGAGKTTLMNVMATLTKPTGGQVRMAGYDLADGAVELRRQIGLVSHKTLLYDDLSAEQNLRFYARMYDVPDKEARIETVLRRVGLWGRQLDPVRTYSRGMQQRLAIARALLHDPPILLLDEPDTGLDQHAAAMLTDLLHEVGAMQRTVLMTTHNLERGLELGDRVAILAGGRIAYQADRSDLDVQRFREAYYHYVDQEG